jgi:hypothetical protein
VWGRLSVAFAGLASSIAACSLVLDTSGISDGGARDAAPPTDSTVDAAEASSPVDSAAQLDSSGLTDAPALLDSSGLSDGPPLPDSSGLSDSSGPFDSSANSDSSSDGSSGDSGGDAADAANTDAPVTLSYRATILADKPLAYWRFGETSGTVASDETGNGNGATLGAGVTWGAPGALLNDTNTAIHLAGTEGLVAGPGFDFAGNAPYSLEAWVELDMPVDMNFRHLFTKDDTLPTGREEYGVYLQVTGGLAFERYVTGTQVKTFAAAPAVNQWTYVVATYSGTELSLYVDGALVGRSQDLRAQASKNASEYLGYKIAAPSVQGYLDEFAIYGAALSDAQVAAHWHASGR